MPTPVGKKFKGMKQYSSRQVFWNIWKHEIHFSRLYGSLQYFSDGQCHLVRPTCSWGFPAWSGPCRAPQPSGRENRRWDPLAGSRPVPAEPPHDHSFYCRRSRSPPRRAPSDPPPYVDDPPVRLRSPEWTGNVALLTLRRLRVMTPQKTPKK